MFSKKYGIRRKHFIETMRGGNEISTPVFLVKYKKNSKIETTFKYSVVVSKKVANKAVNRNNFRRRVRHAINEVIKNNLSKLQIYTVIFFIKSDIKKINYDDLKINVRKVFDRITSLNAVI